MTKNITRGEQSNEFKVTYVYITDLDLPNIEGTMYQVEMETEYEGDDDEGEYLIYEVHSSEIDAEEFRTDAEALQYMVDQMIGPVSWK